MLLLKAVWVGLLCLTTATIDSHCFKSIKAPKGKLYVAVFFG